MHRRFRLAFHAPIFVQCLKMTLAAPGGLPAIGQRAARQVLGESPPYAPTPQPSITRLYRSTHKNNNERKARHIEQHPARRVKDCTPLSRHPSKSHRHYLQRECPLLVNALRAKLRFLFTGSPLQKAREGENETSKPFRIGAGDENVQISATHLNPIYSNKLINIIDILSTEI